MGPAVFDLRAHSLPSVALGSVLLGSVGGGGVYAAVTDQVGGGPVPRIAAGVIGAFLALPALVGLLALPVLVRPRRLVVDHEGIRIEGRTRRDRVRLAWTELAGVGLLVDDLTRPGRLRRAGATAAAQALELVPADDAAVRRHPELDVYWRLGHRRAWRIGLGTAMGDPPAVGEAVTAWRPELWRGRRSGSILGS